MGGLNTPLLPGGPAVLGQPPLTQVGLPDLFLLSVALFFKRHVILNWTGWAWCWVPLIYASAVACWRSSLWPAQCWTSVDLP